MSKRQAFLYLLIILTLPAVACLADTATINDGSDFGPDPKLVAPVKSVIPTVNTAKAVGWAGSQKPVAASGLQVEMFAGGLDHPRWIYVLPNGDVLVAETNKPPKQGVSIKGMIMGAVQKHAGAGGESANRITLLRDADNDGKPEIRATFLKDLYSPFGMALIGNDFYVANADAVVKFPYKEGQTEITEAPVKVADLPAGRNHHWTKSMVASKDDKYLYVGVGSNSNVAENGIEEEISRAAILEIDAATGKTALYASGLRNPVGMDWNPVTGALWTAVNERDELGSDLVPDYMTSVKRGGFYGWPYSYYGQNIDERPKPPRPDLVEKAIKPDYALGAHTASLGLAFYTGNLMPQYKNGAIIGQHGSWNREPLSGYKVIFVPFKNGKPDGKPQDILSGFVSDDAKAWGRPVGVTVDKTGAILVADDVGNAIWRVTPD
jgi:glucose/arabinose dehydrogenase